MGPVVTAAGECPVTAVVERDLRLTAGRTLRTYDSTVGHAAAPLTGCFGSTARHRPVHCFSHCCRRLRCGKSGCYRTAGPATADQARCRDVASAAVDVAQLVDELRVDKFAVMGASGGGPHALAWAALLPGRVTAAACLAGP